MRRNNERISDKTQHTPIASDLFAASAIEFASDQILFVHTPAKLGIEAYTTGKLPTRMLTEFSDRPVFIPFFELVKNRSGEPNLTFPLINKLKYFDFEECNTYYLRQLQK